MIIHVNSLILTDLVIDFKLKKVKIDDAEFKLQIWDTAGQEKYKAITRNFYTNSMAAMIVFDLTSSESFENVRNWVRHANSQAQGDTCKILVGNKSDMVNERIVSKEEIDEMAAELGVEAIEVSAKSGEGINEAFMMISRDIKNKFFSELKSQAPLESILLKKEDDKEKAYKKRLLLNNVKGYIRKSFRTFN